jgi:hypothetical protein
MEDLDPEDSENWQPPKLVKSNRPFKPMKEKQMTTTDQRERALKALKKALSISCGDEEFNPQSFYEIGLEGWQIEALTAPPHVPQEVVDILESIENFPNYPDLTPLTTSEYETLEWIKGKVNEALALLTQGSVK